MSAIMRKMIVVATLAAFGGFCFASAPAFATLRYNIWKTSTDQFQLGYVIGYLDAARLAQRRDYRAAVPITPGKDFTGWVRGVNEYFAKPENANRTVPDAMSEVGTAFRVEILRESGRKQMGILTSPLPTFKP
jgi:hypothetical protein